MTWKKLSDIVNNQVRRMEMGFMDEIAGSGGARLLRFDGRAGHYVVRGLTPTWAGRSS
jgi:hypothetical protein